MLSVQADHAAAPVLALHAKPGAREDVQHFDIQPQRIAEATVLPGLPAATQLPILRCNIKSLFVLSWNSTGFKPRSSLHAIRNGAIPSNKAVVHWRKP